MLEHIKQFLKQNTGSLLFIVFIFLSGFLIYSSSQNNGIEAKKLVNYFFDTAQKVLDGVDSLEKSSATVENKSGDYDKILGQLKSYTQDIDNFVSLIPTGLNDSQGQNLQNDYRSFLTNLRQNKLEFLTTILVERQKVLTDYQTYGDIKNFTQKGNKEELNKSLQAGQRIITSEENILSKNPNVNDKLNQEVKVKQEKETINQLAKFYEKLSSNDLSDSDRQELSKIYESVGWPLSIAPIPKITSADFKDKAFVDELTQIQNQARTLAKKYNINQL
jgi:hypothetical protein